MNQDEKFLEKFFVFRECTVDVVDLIKLRQRGVYAPLVSSGLSSNEIKERARELAKLL
jgi:hypothetical protein